MSDAKTRDADPVAASAAQARAGIEGGRIYLAPIHRDAATALVQPDYPYSFRLRTQRRVWIESNGRKGQRAMFQTQDPKSGRWNKPKASTYCEVLVLYTDHAGHVQTDGVTCNRGPEEVEAFRARAAAALGDDESKRLRDALAVARAYSRIKWEVRTDSTPIHILDAEAMAAEAARQEAQKLEERRLMGALIANERAQLEDRPLPVPVLGTALSPLGGQ